MEPQPTTEGKQVLSDIEQSIQNALALFNAKDHGGGLNPLYVIDDPIVSLHDQNKQKTENTTEFLNSCKFEIPKTKSPPKGADADTEENQVFYDALPFTKMKTSQESVEFPFLDDPVKNTIEEMQRVLNTKADIPSPRIKSPPQQPSPEELLNLYSQDLGIILSPNLTPRRDIDRNFNENDFSKEKQSKKEKKNVKKPKQQKLNKEKKIEPKKGKFNKSEKITNEDIKMRELMNIYGCGDKMNKRKSDSTLGSKSEVSRNASMKKLPNVNISSKASSIAVSRKSKKLKYKFTNDLDINFNEGDLAPLEKSTRLSTKRKTKQKTNNIKPIKKPNLKRKLGVKLSNEELELKLSKNYQTSTRNRNYETHKSKNNSKSFDGNNNFNQKKQLKQKIVNQKQKDYFDRGKAQSVNAGFDKSDNLTILNAVPNSQSQEQYSTIIKSTFPEVQSENVNSFLSNQLQVTDERNQNITNKKLSEERKVSKQVSLKDNIHYHNYKAENLGSDDIGNEVLLEQSTQYHYTLPTQSSKSKEVERFLNGHYQNLPFVIGQSTNKSHNLWVNIQEALSLIKHNIPQSMEMYSSDDKDSERPLSVLSRLTTKNNKKAHQCPAFSHEGLYDIPETNAEGEEGIKSWEDHPDCIQANLDPNFSRPRCSCLPQATLSYKKVLRQIFGGGDESMDLNRARDEMVDQGGDNYTAELRKVLITFTQEFEDLNNKYEELLSDPNSSKEELQQLEMYLETKEEEIREVIARINEVKELNDRLRGETHSRGSGNLEPFKSTMSVQLMQTLRRVQQFKEDLQSKPSVRHLSRTSCTKSLY